MTLLPLLRFNTYFTKPEGLISKDFYKVYLKNHYNFIYGNKALLLLTVGFSVFKLINFFYLRQRPAELFIPDNYFSKLLMPHLLRPEVYPIVAVFSIYICFYLLVKPEHYWLRLILTLQLLWLNMAQWSFGFFSHVAHLLLLAHLFLIFVPFKITTNKKEAQIIAETLNWFYAGLLLTYSLSGLWKWLGLAYKLFFKPTAVHWLHPDASLFNAVVSFRNYDLEFNLLPLFAYPLIWQAGFIIILLIQTFCILAAFQPQFRVGVGLALIIFHSINAVVFVTVFITAPLVLVCLFFPYHTLSGKFRRLQLRGS